MNLLIL